MRGDANESVSIGVEHLLDHTHVVLIHCLDAVEALRSTRKYTALKRLVKVVRFVTRYIPYYNTSYSYSSQPFHPPVWMLIDC